jgi:hypothetical protein
MKKKKKEKQEKNRRPVLLPFHRRQQVANIHFQSRVMALHGAGEIIVKGNVGILEPAWCRRKPRARGTQSNQMVRPMKSVRRSTSGGSIGCKASRWNRGSGGVVARVFVWAFAVAFAVAGAGVAAGASGCEGKIGGAEEPGDGATSGQDGGTDVDGSGQDPDGMVTACDGVDCGPNGQCVASGGDVACECDQGYHPDGLTCVADDPCAGVGCSGHGVCVVDSNDEPQCDCDEGYTAEGLFCVEDNDPCSGQTCSGHGTCWVWDGTPVCACDEGYTPSSSVGLDCVPTDTVCVGGAIDYDYDNDGQNDAWFEPNDWECWMYELVNYTRATHDDEGAPECHTPLMWDVEWAAHGRNHSHQMQAQGSLFHADYPGGQNCAYGCDPPCEMDMYMTGPSEPHCPELSHHCNIMRCSFSHIGIGYVDDWNTQNFY